MSAGILPALMTAGFQLAWRAPANSDAGYSRRNLMPAKAGAPF
jgi:hypothetical protein